MDASLTNERAEQVRRLFDEALERISEDRAVYLEQACRDDPSLLGEVEALLEAFDDHDTDVRHLLEHLPLTPHPSADASRERIETEPDALLGQAVSHYQIQEKLGGGGMGTVYKAHDTHLDRTVALKFLPPDLTRDPEARDRFIHEARAASALDHVNICTIYEIGETSEGRTFIAMACYDGETLKAKIERGPLPLDEAIGYTLQVAEGLKKAHQAGIIHRDVKPANVIVTADGVVKIVDFGLAKVRDVSLTQTGRTLGTVAYMSPEQARGEAVDPRTDIWSLGVVLYEMVVGRHPFRGGHEQSVIHSILHEEPEALTGLRTGVPMALERVVAKCLSKEAGQRYQHVDEVAVDLNTIDCSERGASRIGTAPVDQRRSTSSWFSGKVLWGLLLGLVIGILVSSVALWLLRPAFTPADTKSEQTSLPFLPTPPMSLLPGVGNDLAISPDGKMLAYVLRTDSGPRLYLRSVDQAERIEEIPGSEHAQHPFFSRDGTVLGFHTAGRFMKVNLDDPDRTPRIINSASSIPMGATWKNDGTVIFGNGYAGLFRVSSDSIDLIVEPDTTKGEFAYYWPEMLPDDRELLVTIWRGNNINEATIAILSLETNEIKDLGLSGTNARYAPSGHLVYATRDNNMGQIMAVPFDLQRQDVAGTPIVVLRGVDVRPRGAVSLSFSNEGRLAYFSQQVLLRSLVWVGRRGDRAALTQDKRPYGSPRLSPDGQFVAVNVDADLYLLDIARGELSDVIPGEGNNFEPIWHPSGDSLVFTSGESGHFYLHVVPVDGSEEPKLLISEKGDSWASSWSPDGEVLAYYVRETVANRDIYMWSRQDGSVPYLVTEANERAPMFSPDGRWIAYMSDASGRDEIWVRPYPPREREEYQVSRDGGAEPVWWPPAPLRGQWLSYRKGDQMMVVEVETASGFTVKSEPVVYFEGQYFSNLIQSQYDIHPDDDRFLMVAPEQMSRQINLKTNWFEELKRLVPTDK